MQETSEGLPSARANARTANINDRIAGYYPALEKLASNGSPHGGALSTSMRDGFGAALKSLQRGLTGDRHLAGASYFSQGDYLGAYLLYYWPVSYAQTSLALEEMRMRGVLPRIRRVLDMGAGPGPASFAAALLGVDSVRLMDSNPEALEAALRLRESLPDIHAEFSITLRDFMKDERIDGGPYDLIVACHSANELWKGQDNAMERRTSLFGMACEQLTEGGILLVIEPSANSTGRPALALRDNLLSRASLFDISCVAPCPGSFPCPIASAGEGRSCHSTWPWNPPKPVAALASAAGLDRDSAKATWFALRKGNGRLLAERGHEEAPLDAFDCTFRLEGRVVSEPMLNKAGRLRYILCTSSGLATLSAKAGDADARAAGFFALRRGDCITAEALEKRANENSFGFVPGAKLRAALKAPEA